MSDLAVLQVVASTDRRGAETFAVELGKALRTDGVSVETVALAPGRTGGLGLDALGRAPLALSTLRALHARSEGADVVIAHGSTTLPACALALGGSRTPFVYRNIGDPRYWSSDALRRWRTIAFLARARRVVALSNTAARVLRRRHRVRWDRLEVIPTGVPGRRFRPATEAERRDARARFDLVENQTVAAVVGALSPEKAVDRAILALNTSGIDMLVVAGDGPERRRLEELAGATSPGRVRFTGSIADPTAVYWAADLMMLTSRTEGLPAVLIEAGLCGLPVVATDVGFVRDIVVDGATGVVVESGDPSRVAIALAEARALGSCAGVAAREHCLQHFELDVVADRWRGVLLEVTG